MDGKADCVDAETRNALLELKGEIIDAVREIVKDSNETLEKTLRELHDMRFQHIEDEQKRSFKYHEEHFKAINDLKESSAKERQGIRDSIIGEMKELREKVDSLESRQSADEGMEAGKDKAASSQFNKKTAFWTAAGVVLAALIFLAGLAMPGGQENPPALPPNKEIPESSE